MLAEDRGRSIPCPGVSMHADTCGVKRFTTPEKKGAAHRRVRTLVSWRRGGAIPHLCGHIVCPFTPNWVPFGRRSSNYAQ